MVYTSGKCSDRAGNCVGCIMADDDAAGAILLVGDAHGGSGSHRERVERSAVLGMMVWSAV